MKKVIAVMLALVIVVLTPGLVVHAAYADTYANAGDLHGFIVAETGTIDMIGAETILYMHEGTGARVLHIANDDTHRSIMVSFETPTHDNRGIPHILEHMVLAGSKNFPALNLFFSLLYQTYSTNINAFVMNSATAYLYSTMSEAQLLLITEYLMDSVFFPLIYQYEMIFGQEAWRYEMADADSPLNVTGIVYNEMRGAMGLHSTAHHNWINTLLPGTVAANNAGGNPEDILNLTLEDLLAYHETYYHPSNMLVFLYGDVDIASFLSVIGAYCDMFGFQDIHVEKGHIEPFAEPVRAVFEFPSPMGAPVENSAVLHYAIHLGHVGIEMNVSLDVLALLLGINPSPVIANLSYVFPGGSFGVTQVDTTLGANILVTGIGLNEEDMDAFQEAIHAALYYIVENGFDPELVEAVIAAYEFSVLSFPESTHLGIIISQVLLLCDSVGLGLNYFNDLMATLERARTEYAYGYFENIIEELILSNPHRALVATVPAPGLREELDDELRQRLDEKRAGMTDEEVDALIAQNEIFAEMAASTPDEAIIESLNAVTVDTLPMEVRTFTINEREHYGARILTSEAAVGGIYSIVLDFNAAAVTLEELHFLNLYASLVGMVPTVNYDLATLQTQLFRYLNSFGVSAWARPFSDFSLRPAVVVGWSGLNDDFPSAAALAMEMLLHSDVTDLEAISAIVRRLETGMRAGINSNPMSLIATRAAASYDERVAFVDYMRGLAYVEFLSNAVQMIEDEPEAFIASLESVRNRLMYLEGSAAIFAGNADGVHIFEENLDILIGHLQEGSVPVADLSGIPLHPSREAIITDSAVQSNLLFIPFAGIDPDSDIEFIASISPLIEVLNDGHLTPEVRFTIGAYGVFAMMDRYGITMLSFWDPAIAETFAAYVAAADFIRYSELAQSDLDRFIISVFAGATTPMGELTGAINAALSQYMGFYQGSTADFLASLTAATIDDLAALADVLDLASEIGVWITAGSGSAIYANAHLFDSIIYAFGEPGDEPRGISRLEFLQTILGTDMDGLYEMAVDLGLILDIASPFDPVTREEFAFVLIMASGGADVLVHADINITDAHEISEWALAAVITSLVWELLALDEYGNFNPHHVVTFEELWALLN